MQDLVTRTSGGTSVLSYEKPLPRSKGTPELRKLEQENSFLSRRNLKAMFSV